MPWTPPEDVQDHSGTPFKPGSVFFADPPAEIGDVVSAATTLTADKRPWGMGVRAGIAGAVGALATFGLSAAGMDARSGLLVVSGVIGGFCALIAWFATRFRHTCSFVGKAGVARFACSGDPESVSPPALFLFKDATELRTKQTRSYVNGVYSGTSYDYGWTDAAGRRRFRLNGTYYSEAGTPKPKDPFHFASAAELSWSVHLLDLAQAQLDQAGFVPFRLSGTDAIRVGRGFLEIEMKGQTERIEADTMGECQIAGGTFTFKRKDAKSGFLGIGRQGIYTFDYANMANAKLFLLSLDRLLGLSFS